MALTEKRSIFVQFVPIYAGIIADKLIIFCSSFKKSLDIFPLPLADLRKVVCRVSLTKIQQNPVIIDALE